MFYFEVHSTINKIINLYHLLGIWKRDEKSVYHEWGRKLFHLILSISILVSLMSGALQSEYFGESIFLFTLAIEMAVVIVKLLYTLWKKNEILCFLQAASVHRIAIDQGFTQVSRKLKMFMNFVSLYSGMLIVALVVLAIDALPIFSHNKNLLFKIGFLSDWKTNAISYWITYAYVMMQTVLNLAYLLINVILWYIMFNCSLKYQILEMQFKSMGTSQIAISKRKIVPAEKQNLFLQELIELIKSHQVIHETIERFRYIFSKLFFAQLSTSGASICGAIFVLAFSSHESLFQSVGFVIFILNNTFDIFMILYLGNEIKSFSGRLSYGLFQSDWIDQSKLCKKCILILMEVLTQPQELVVGSVYPLNLETFTSILKFAYSSFNILLHFK